MADENYQVDLPNTVFWGSEIFEISNQSGSDTREVFLSIYKSPLGAELKEREPSRMEVREIRNACRFLTKLVRESDAGEVDEYFIEFASGDGPVEQIDPSKRTVFAFERETGCDGPFSIVAVS